MVCFRIEFACKQLKSQLIVTEREWSVWSHRKSWGGTGRADIMDAKGPQRGHYSLSELLQLQTLCPCPRQEEAGRPKGQGFSFRFWLYFKRETLPGLTPYWQELGHVATSAARKPGMSSNWLEEGRREGIYGRLLSSPFPRVCCVVLLEADYPVLSSFDVHIIIWKSY